MVRMLFLVFFLIFGYNAPYADNGITGSSERGGRKGVGISTDVILAAMPLATLGGMLYEKDWSGMKQGFFSAGTALGSALILKSAVKENRPDFSDRRSFPSGHASLVFCNAAFLQRRYGWKVGVPAYALASYVGFGRIYSQKHHWWDVVAGAALGAGCALLYTKPYVSNRDLSFSAETFEDGFSVSVSVTF